MNVYEKVYSAVEKTAHLFFDLLCNALHLTPVGNVAFVVCDIVYKGYQSQSESCKRNVKGVRFSVSMGCVSSTATVQCLKARVLASNPPMPDEPPVITMTCSPQSSLPGVPALRHLFAAKPRNPKKQLETQCLANAVNGLLTDNGHQEKPSNREVDIGLCPLLTDAFVDDWDEESEERTKDGV
jgi:hypothetical protein